MVQKHKRRRKSRGVIFCLLIILFIGIGVYKFLNRNDFTRTGLDALNAMSIDSKKGSILLVNNEYVLSKDYVPKDLTIPKIKFVEEAIEEEKHLTRDVARQIEKLFKESSKEGIIYLGTSGYRSYKSQENIYNREIRKSGKEKADEYVATPGTSEHQTGLCIDVTNKERYFVGSSKEAQWLEKNAHKYGFIIRFPEGKENITGKAYEPWHIRYVGVDIATEIYKNKLTLEEYLGE